ncbi:MAG: VOC family protein [Janthinobacterium lividum]
MRGALSLLGLSLLAAPLFAQQPTRPAITGIAFFRDYSTQQAAAETFYGPTMGFPELKSAENGGTLAFAVNHSQWVEVLTNTPPPRASRRMAAVGFTTRDVKGLERYLNARGVATAEPMHDGEFAVRDPEGILVYFDESPYPTATGDKHLVGIAKQVSESQPLPSATSQRIIHVGFIVQSADKEDTFWREILGFKPYWHGYAKEGETSDDYVSIQVPDGTDWIEYMLHQPADPDLHTSGVMDHFSLGTPRMQDVLAQLQRNNCTGKDCTSIQAGRDGKVQLNMYDPDQTRIEYMEFTPAMKPCCSPFTGTQPGLKENE